MGGGGPSGPPQKKILEGLLRTPERKLVPRNLGRVEQLRLQTFVIAPEAAADRGGRIRDDDDRDAWIRVNVDQAIEPDVEAAFFAGFAQGRCFDGLATIDEPAW